MPFKDLPEYFRRPPEVGGPAVDSTQTNPLDLVKHKSCEELYESIPKDTGTYHYKLIVFARHGEDIMMLLPRDTVKMFGMRIMNC